MRTEQGVPTINVAAPLDTECSDFPHGSRVATFLAETLVDVHILSSGGHNVRVWKAEFPYGIQWLSAALQGPEHG